MFTARQTLMEQAKSALSHERAIVAVTRELLHGVALNRTIEPPNQGRYLPRGRNNGSMVVSAIILAERPALFVTPVIQLPK